MSLKVVKTPPSIRKSGNEIMELFLFHFSGSKDFATLQVNSIDSFG